MEFSWPHLLHVSLGLRLRQSCAGNRIALLGRAALADRPAHSGAVAAAAVRRNSEQAFGAEFPEPADWANLQLDRSAQQQVQVSSQPQLTAHILQLHAGLGKTKERPEPNLPSGQELSRAE